jgi:hypothetical protein
MTAISEQHFSAGTIKRWLGSMAWSPETLATATLS